MSFLYVRPDNAITGSNGLEQINDVRGQNKVEVEHAKKSSASPIQVHRLGLTYVEPQFFLLRRAASRFKPFSDGIERELTS